MLTKKEVRKCYKAREEDGYAAYNMCDGMLDEGCEFDCRECPYWVGETKHEHRLPTKECIQEVSRKRSKRSKYKYGQTIYLFPTGYNVRKYGMELIEGEVTYIGPSTFKVDIGDVKPIEFNRRSLRTKYEEETGGGFKIYENKKQFFDECDYKEKAYEIKLWFKDERNKGKLSYNAIKAIHKIIYGSGEDVTGQSDSAR